MKPEMFQRHSFIIPFLCVIFSITSSVEVNKNDASVISRNHVSVWFDYSVRYYEHEAENAYSKQDLRVMVDLVSTRFGQIVIRGAPTVDKLPLEDNEIPHSLIRIPSVVAEHNVQDPSRPMQVIVTYQLAKLLKTDQVTSFDVAKYMADQANDIHPGTVTTLMLDLGAPFINAYLSRRDSVGQLKLAREKINKPGSKYGYTLATFMSLRDCGHFQGPLGQKAKEYLPHVEMIALLLSTNIRHLTFDPETLHKMMVTKFEECEAKLKEEKPDLKVVPSVLWMSRGDRYVTKVLEGWEILSKWAEKNDKQLIMFEAFDTPQGHLFSDLGWWTLKNKAEHMITKDIFLEKIQEAKGNASRYDTNSYSTEDNAEEEDEELSYKKKGERRQSLHSSLEPAPYSVYVVLTLLSVICTLLVAVTAGLVYGFHKMLRQTNAHLIANEPSIRATSSSSGVQVQNNGFCRRTGVQTLFDGLEEEDGENASLQESVLEIKDTTPITSVTYKNGER